MDNTFPQIDRLPPSSSFNHNIPPQLPPEPWYRGHRFVIFILTFVISAILTLGYVFSRSALYRSHATLLTVAQTAIDQQSGDADIQHVAIQRQTLRSKELLERTLVRLSKVKETVDFFSNFSDADLRQMLTVEVVPNTNLLELAAIGSEPDMLAPLINTWVEVYLGQRVSDIKQTTGVTINIIKEELLGLRGKILSKRGALEVFRERNEITSLSRDNIFENQSLATFKGLIESRGKASEEVIKAKARLDTVKRSIALGKVVVPNEDQRVMRGLELRLQGLREQLSEVDKKYTREYLALNPSLNVIPLQVEELQEQIRRKRQYGKNIVLSDAEQAYDAAKQSLGAIQEQLDEHKEEAANFSAKFSEHETMLAEMESLVLLRRSAQERLVQVETRLAEKFPQVTVIEPAFPASKPFSPNYMRDASIATIASLLLGLLVVWIVSFLTKKEMPIPPVSVTNNHLYKDITPEGLGGYSQSDRDLLAQNSPQSLGQSQANQIEQIEQIEQRELSLQEVEHLLDASDRRAKQLICLLLSGLSLEEIAELTQHNIDLEKKVVIVPGDNHRLIQLGRVISTLFGGNAQPCPAWSKGERVSTEMLQSILIYAVIDAGLKNPKSITASSISYSYVLYLVRQGVRLSEVEEIVGSIEPIELSRYSRFSPEKRGLSLADISLLYPALKKYSI